MKVWETAAILEKNKLSSDAPFLLLLKLHHADLPEDIYLARNTEDVVWSGRTWTRFPLSVTPVTTDGTTLPTVNLTVSNCGGIIQSYLQRYGGMTDAAVTLYVVHTKLLDNPEPLDQLDFTNLSTSYDEAWVTFKLGSSPELYNKFPLDTYMVDFCPFVFKSVRCGYAGTDKPCNNTFKECRIKERFGGEQGMTGNYG